MEPAAGDIWHYADSRISEREAHFLFHNKIKTLNEETQTWYALCLETGRYEKTYWFSHPEDCWTKVA